MTGRYQPRQPIWYLDQSGNVKTGAFSSQEGDKVTVSVSQGPPPVTVREVDTFDNEVAANRASLSRASVHTNRPGTGGVSFIKK